MQTTERSLVISELDDRVRSRKVLEDMLAFVLQNVNPQDMGICGNRMGICGSRRNNLKKDEKRRICLTFKKRYSHSGKGK